MQKCQTSNGSEDVDFDLELQSKDGEKYFQMKVKLNRTINDQCTVSQLKCSFEKVIVQLLYISFVDYKLLF